MGLDRRLSLAGSEFCHPFCRAVCRWVDTRECLATGFCVGFFHQLDSADYLQHMLVKVFLFLANLFELYLPDVWLANVRRALFPVTRIHLLKALASKEPHLLVAYAVHAPVTPSSLPRHISPGRKVPRKDARHARESNAPKLLGAAGQ